MAGANDIMGVQQTGVAVLSALQETQAKLVPTNSSGTLSVNSLVQSGFVRVLGVSVMAGSGTGFLHDAAALADAGASNAIYSIPTVTGFYATNMVFHKGLVFRVGTGTIIAVFYTRV